jgi:hypothetical protein
VVNEMAELVLSIKLEGEEADLAVLEAWLKSDERLDFSTLALLLTKITNYTISKITVVTTTQEVTSTNLQTEQLYPKP